MEGAKVDPDNGHAGLIETGGERKERSLFKFKLCVYKPKVHISNLLAGLPVHITMDQVILYCCWDT